MLSFWQQGMHKNGNKECSVFGNKDAQKLATKNTQYLVTKHVQFFSIRAMARIEKNSP